MSPDEAIEIVARHVIASAAESVEWELYLEIGEHDWERVIEKVDELAPFPAYFGAAYQVLEDRASSRIERNDYA